MKFERLSNDAFLDRLAGFIRAAQVKVDDYGVSMYNERHAQPKLRVDGNGIKYIKIVKPGSGVYVFINRETGDVLKAKSWSAPVTNNPRSNINDEDFGASGVNWHGAVYLR